MLLNTVFMAVLRRFYVESQDLAKKKCIWATEICPLAKLAKLIFGLEGSQAYCQIKSNTIYYIKLQFSLSVCLYPPFFRHDRRNATKFGTHIWVDMGFILS